MKILDRRANIPQYLKQSQDQLVEFVQSYTEADKVNYRDMIQDLRNFDYDRATNEKAVIIRSSRSSAHSDILNSL